MANIIHLKILPEIACLWVRTIKGEENIPKEKIGLIVTCNHASYLDHFIFGGIIGRATKRMVHFLAKKEHFKGAQRKWHKFLEAIPIDRQTGGKTGLEEAVKALKKGKIIAIYPEGTRTLTGKLQRAKTGVARLALTAKVPVLPIGLTNTFKILPKGKSIPRFTRTDVNIGKLMYFNKYYGKENNKKTLRLVTTKIMKEIAKFCKQKYEFD
jgi:1-acyl-sn-glycerol-3-phosphate acyltransferase